MAQLEVTFHNQATIKVQAQIYEDRTLVSTCLVGPGETCLLKAEAGPYDIYCKNSATGWEVARQLGTEATSVTLLRKAGRYAVKGS